MLAVRCKPHGEGRVRDYLAELSDVTSLASQRLLLATFPEDVPDAVVKQLQQWSEEGFVELVAPVFRDPDSQLVQIPTDEITVRFKAGLSSDKREHLEKKHKVSVARQNEFIPNQYVVKLPKDETRDIVHVAEKMNAEQEVEFATPNYISQYRR
jgi:hypothetical protein